MALAQAALGGAGEGPLPRAEPEGPERAARERDSAVAKRVRRQQERLAELVKGLPGKNGGEGQRLHSEERLRLQREAEAALVRGVGGLPLGARDREARAKAAAAAAEAELERLARLHYNPMLSARLLAAQQP